MECSCLGALSIYECAGTVDDENSSRQCSGMHYSVAKAGSERRLSSSLIHGSDERWTCARACSFAFSRVCGRYGLKVTPLGGKELLWWYI